MNDPFRNGIEDVAVSFYPVNDIVLESFSIPKDPVVIMQKGLMFKPRMTMVQEGRTAIFPNRDPSQHHLYSFSPAHPFEFRLYKGESPEILLDKTGVVKLGCNIHDWMMGFIIVVDTPFYGLTDSDGEFSIDNLPGGEYIVKYWHSGMEEGSDMISFSKEPVKVGDESGVISFTLKNPSIPAWPRKPGYLDKQYD